MFEWLSLDEAASAIADATGEGIQPGSLLREAFSGSLAVCAVIPSWTAPGGGELVFYTADGGRICSATDGVFRHLSKYDFQALQTHKRLTLAGRRVELPNAATGGVIEAFIGPDAPTINIGDLCVSTAEVQRFVSSRSEVEANDTALPPSDQGEDQQEENVFAWKDQARAIADELHRRDMVAGAWSSNSDIANRVAKECVQRGVLGPRGRLTANNILREALQGWRWKRPTK